MPAILRLVVLQEFISVNRDEIILRCVTPRVSAGAGRVLIEVLDECNGLPGSKVSDRFGPFEQRGADRTGAGLGLAFSRWGADANKAASTRATCGNEDVSLHSISHELRRHPSY